jgi:hypothetical protein
MSLKIILFDDMQENSDAVLAALRSELAGNGSVLPFAAGAGGKKEGTFEERLELDLTIAPNAPIDLIVADRDLSSYAPDYTGLSESTVRRVADMVGVPECGYARGERADDNEYIKRGEQRESCIRLSRKPNDAAFAKQVVAVGNGFAEITKKLSEMMEPAARKSPGRMLASVLGKPEYAEKISLFASGDQGRLGALAAVRGSKDAGERNRRLACVLGYWLWDSVLRFPGVVLNEVAASSYLNIRLDEFRQNERIRQLFAGAIYAGPFAAAKPTLWWRGMLDDLVAEAGAADGRVYAAMKLGTAIARSECCEDASKPAGYYCFLSERPVSLENSKPGLPWFPRGADLARVCKSRYAEDEPWL